MPIDFLMSYPKVLIKGTIKEPPPIPSGTEIKPIIIPEIFFIKLDNPKLDNLDQISKKYLLVNLKKKFKIFFC